MERYRITMQDEDLKVVHKDEITVGVNSYESIEVAEAEFIECIAEADYIIIEQDTGFGKWELYDQHHV